MENYNKNKVIEYLEEIKGVIVNAEEYINCLKDIQQELEAEVAKPDEYIIEYPEECFTWAEGDTIYANFPFDAYDIEKWQQLGEVRATKEEAEEAARRNIRGNRLEALAHSIGGVYKFSPDRNNFFIEFDSNTLEAMYNCSSTIFSAERVYMTEETAWKVVEILNSGTYKLNKNIEGN